MTKYGLKTTLLASLALSALLLAIPEASATGDVGKGAWTGVNCSVTYTPGNNYQAHVDTNPPYVWTTGTPPKARAYCTIDIPLADGLDTTSN